MDAQVEEICDAIDAILFEAKQTVRVAGGLATTEGIILSFTEPIVLSQRLCYLVKGRLGVQEVLTAVGLLILPRPTPVPTIDIMTLIRQHEADTIKL